MHCLKSVIKSKKYSPLKEVEKFGKFNLISFSSFLYKIVDLESIDTRKAEFNKPAWIADTNCLNLQVERQPKISEMFSDFLAKKMPSSFTITNKSSVIKSVNCNMAKSLSFLHTKQKTFYALTTALRFVWSRKALSLYALTTEVNFGTVQSRKLSMLWRLLYGSYEAAKSLFSYALTTELHFECRLFVCSDDWTTLGKLLFPYRSKWILFPLWCSFPFDFAQTTPNVVQLYLKTPPSFAN